MCLLMIVVVSFGCALTLKASVGVGAWDALAQTGSAITGIKVGTVGMMFNLSCVLIQFVILKKDFKINHAMQIVLCVAIGYAVNFFYYTVLGRVTIRGYGTSLFLLVIGYVINAFTVAAIILLGVVNFSLEGACQLLSSKVGIAFPVFRQGVDMFCVAAAVLVAVAFRVPLSVREGTIIEMLMFGPVIGIFLKVLKPVFKKYDLTDCS